jgi:hypothetical protein
MEGNGPTAGAPRQVGYLAVSENPHALDKCLADLIGLPVERTPTLAAAQARGLLPENMTVFGQPEPIPDYDIPAGGGLLFEGRGGASEKTAHAVMGRVPHRPAGPDGGQVCLMQQVRRGSVPPGPSTWPQAAEIDGKNASAASVPGVLPPGGAVCPAAPWPASSAEILDSRPELTNRENCAMI